MTVRTDVANLKINKLTKEQFESIETPSETELYLVVDDGGVSASEIETALGYTPASDSNFIGADGTNAGFHGLVPTPAATDNDKYLRGDGSWAEAQGGSTVIFRVWS